MTTVHVGIDLSIDVMTNFFNAIKIHYVNKMVIELFLKIHGKRKASINVLITSTKTRNKYGLKYICSSI